MAKTIYDKILTREQWDELCKELIAERMEIYKKNKERQKKWRDNQKEQKNVRKKSKRKR